MNDLVVIESGAIEHQGGADRLGVAVAGWLAEKYSLTHSERTRDDYGATLRRFREYLSRMRQDLDAPGSVIGLAAQSWADEGEPSQATYNLRLAVLSSFYEYAIRRELLEGPNPITSIKRSKVQRYANAIPIPAEQVIERLGAIDRSTLQGKRDYALLSIGVTTGRRLAELHNLNLGDVQILGADAVVLTWRRVKGGSTMRDRLAKRVAHALLAYLKAVEVYRREHNQTGTDSPVWMNFSLAYEGQRLGRKGIADVCQAHIGTTKTHTLRHTFAGLLEKQRATITQIQRKLGHVNPATTGEYLMHIQVEEDPLGDDIAELLNI